MFWSLVIVTSKVVSTNVVIVRSANDSCPPLPPSLLTAQGGATAGAPY